MSAPVSSVNIIGGFFYVGDIDGGLYVWSLEGDILWNTNLGDRVESISIADQHQPTLLFATVGVEIKCLEAETGKSLWSYRLEGSSDDVVCNSKATLIVATSSVFDVEHLDYMESACWKFDTDGKLLNVSRFDERPWYLGLLDSNETIMGLGRPNCGAKLFLENNEFLDLKITSKSPVTCGTGRANDTILGHADGGITCIMDNKEVYCSKNSDESSTSILDSTSEFVLQIQESGRITFFNKNSEAWHMDFGHNVERGIIGFCYAGASTIWLTYHVGEESIIEVLNTEKKSQVCSFSISSRVRDISSNDRFVIIGLEDGNVYVVESEQFSRRMSETKEKSKDEDSSYRREMLERLRNLNKD